MEDKRKLAINYIKCNLADYFNYNNFNLLLASLEVQKANKAFSGLKGKNSNTECLFLLSFLSNLEYDLPKNTETYPKRGKTFAIFTKCHVHCSLFTFFRDF